MRGLWVFFVVSLVSLQTSASQDDHFLRSLKSDSDGAGEGNYANSIPFYRALRSSHFLRALRASFGSKDLQRILRSDPSMPSHPQEMGLAQDTSSLEPAEFSRNLRTNGDHFLRSLRGSDSQADHFLRSLRSAHDFMRMVRRSDDHFLRSLRDLPAEEDNIDNDQH